MKDISEAVRGLIEVITSWYKCIRSPMATLEALLLLTEERKFTEIAGIGSIAFIVGVLVQIPLHNLFGIELKTIGFYICNALATAAVLFVLLFCVHFMLLRHRQKSKLLDIAAIYMVTVFSFSPLVNLATLPANYAIFNLIYTMKKEQTKVFPINLEFIQKLFERLSLDNDVVSATSSSVASWGGFICLIVFAECLVQWFSNSRYETYYALAAAFLLSVVINFFIIVPFIMFSYWSFIKV